MFNLAWWQWFLGVLGLLIFGALSSGIWEVVLKPIYAALVKSALWLVTFGYKSARDTLYEEAAKGRNDRTMLLLVQIAIIFFVPYFLENRLIRIDSRSIADTQDTLTAYALVEREYTPEEYKLMSPAQKEDVDKQVETAKEILHQNDRQKAREAAARLRSMLEVQRKAWWINIAICLYPSWLLIRSLRIFLINSIISDYQQRFAICRAFLQQGDQWLLESRFASMKTRADYAKIMQDARMAIAAAQGPPLPMTLF